jgi:uncharacterized NAD-dependent epimerase/dehydratase family protein
MHGSLDDRKGERGFGKMGFGLLRYAAHEIVAVVDEDSAGLPVPELTGIDCDVPVVATVGEAAAIGADVLVIGVATSGGVLPDRFRRDLDAALEAGLSVVNGLHVMLAEDPVLAAKVQPGRFIWDIRREPHGLRTGSALAASLPGRRILTVGTDMAIGKMTASLELDRAARRRGLRSKFLATGQIGITISGDGIPLDSIRVDFASGAVEQMVERHAADHDLLWVEGQGSIANPASTAWLPLVRGSCPTHLILCHRAGHRFTLAGNEIPPLPVIIEAYETVAAIAGVEPGPRVVGITVNTARLSAAEAAAELRRIEDETGVATVDVIRDGPDRLLDAVLAL